MPVEQFEIWIITSKTSLYFCYGDVLFVFDCDVNDSSRYRAAYSFLEHWYVTTQFLKECAVKL